jgi:hypothetical protein
MMSREKKRIMKAKTISFLSLSLLITLEFAVSAADDSELCKISLHSLSKTSGTPGDTFEMHGVWGDMKGTKTPCINKGGANKFEVLSWSNSVIKVRIPDHLTAGSYKVGVYCNYPPQGGSSRWKNFEVIKDNGTESTTTEIQSSNTKTMHDKMPQKADTQTKKPESDLRTGYSQTLHQFKLGDHNVEGTIVKFEFPDQEITFLYVFNFIEWNELNEKTNQAVVRLYDSMKRILDEGSSICIKGKYGKNFGSIVFNKTNRENVDRVAYFSLTASPCAEGQHTLHQNDNPELRLLFENASTIKKIFFSCLESGKSEQTCICSNKSKLEEPLRAAVSFLQKHPELKGKEILLHEESFTRDGGSEKVSISMPLDELPRIQNELRRCK